MLEITEVGPPASHLLRGDRPGVRKEELGGALGLGCGIRGSWDSSPGSGAGQGELPMGNQSPKVQPLPP